ncbi:MAG: hypothetical protein ACYCXY_10930 [Acidimicrobiales bacterium]
MATKDVKAGAHETAPEPDDSGADSDDTYRQPKSLREIAGDLWRPRFGTRREPGAGQRVPTTKDVVNGLARNELAIGTALLLAELAITIADYLVWHHSHDLKLRQLAPDALVAGLVGTAIMALGVALHRRALLGFAAFIVGMESISFGNVFGLIYLFFGGWLIMRVMRKQRQDKALGLAASSADPRRTTRSARSTRPVPSGPKPSKRYTPPRRSAAARKR